MLPLLKMTHIWLYDFLVSMIHNENYIILTIYPVEPSSIFCACVDFWQQSQTTKHDKQLCFLAYMENTQGKVCRILCLTLLTLNLKSDLSKMIRNHDTVCRFWFLYYFCNKSIFLRISCLPPICNCQFCSFRSILQHIL